MEPKTNDRDSSPDMEIEREARPIIVRNTTDLQRLKLEKLMKNPEKPILIPERPKERGVPVVPDFVRNVMGSSAGAGSGEFHVYRHLRRKEYARQKYMKEKGERERLDNDYHAKLEENKKKADERTAKRRQKRLKRKQKQKGKKPKVGNKSSQSDEPESSSSSSNEDETDEKESETNEDNKNEMKLEIGNISEDQNNMNEEKKQPINEKDISHEKSENKVKKESEDNVVKICETKNEAAHEQEKTEDSVVANENSTNSC